MNSTLRLALTTLILGCAACCCAQAVASGPVASLPRAAAQMVTFNPATDSHGYLALPHGPGRHPAIIAIHEWWGLNDWVRAQADQLAAAGYVVLAPDLYHGKSADTPQGAMALVQTFDRQRGLDDLQAAYAYLDRRRDVGDIGVIGWCFGGGLSAALAERQPGLKACVVYYGEVPGDVATAARIHAPVLGNFGGADRSITPDKVKAFEQAMQQAGRPADVKIYPGMPHAFAGSRATAPEQIAAAHDAWTRTLAFLRAHLRRQ